MDDDTNNLDYPNLVTCQVKLIGSAALSSRSSPPVELPKCIRTAWMDTPSYMIQNENENEKNENNNNNIRYDDFSLERAVLKRLSERECDRELLVATSKDEIEKATISKMKHVTGEMDESVCIGLLQDHGYDLKESIEAYLDEAGSSNIITKN